MNQLFKQAVAFAVVAVMLFGMVPAQSVEAHSHTQSSVAPFSSTEALIQQVKEQLIAQGAIQYQRPVNQAAVEAVEEESDYTFNQAMSVVALGIFNGQGSEGVIDTSRLNLSSDAMDALLDETVKSYALEGSVALEPVVENGVVTSVNYTATESFAQVMEEITVSAQEPEKAEAEAEAQEPAAQDEALPFEDVSASFWGEPFVRYVYENGLMNGTGEKEFSPMAKLSRAMVVTVLWRMAGSPEPKGEANFTDLGKPNAGNSWYFKPIAWAQENGIASGLTATTFGPNENVTRQQMVTFLGRFAEYCGEVIPADASVSNFQDSNKIESYAVPYVAWAVEEGIVNGYEDNTFRPTGEALRVEFAKVITVFHRDVLTVGCDHADKVFHEAVASTCTESGMKAYYTCECGAILDENGNQVASLDELVIPAQHAVTNYEAVAATCKDEGMAAYASCSVCGTIWDAAGSVVEDIESLKIPAGDHAPADPTQITWNWERVVSQYYNTDENGQPTFHQGLVGPDGNPIPDFPLDENNQPIVGLYFDAESGTVYASYQEIITWVCPTISFTCGGCNETMTSEATVTSYTNPELTEAEIAAKTEEYATKLAEEAIGAYVQQKYMEYYMANGAEPSAEQQQAWVAEAQQDPAVMGPVAQQAQYYAFMVAKNMLSTIYVATVGEGAAAITNEINATEEQLKVDWANMSSFIRYFPQYYGLIAPYWSSKNTEESPLGAILNMANMTEMAVVPTFYMDMTVAGMTQAFMSYVMQYASLLDPVLEEAMALVNYEELDEIDKLLLLHDWMAANGTFDMQSLTDMTSGTSTPDPISMTAFGLLLNEMVEKAEGSTWDGATCVGYAATYAILVQQAFGVTQDDPAIVDFGRVQYLASMSDVSVAEDESGFGTGAFNAPHYINAVKVGNNWYYVDACYDDINTEVISQCRVETEGNVSHDNFLMAPSSWEVVFQNSMQYMDSLYDGKVWNRIPDGQGGYMMQDIDGNTYTETEAKAIQGEAAAAGKSVQMIYVYEATETTEETRYEDDTYEKAWFVEASSAVTYDPETQYFYYTASPISSPASMKDLMGMMGGESEGEDSDDSSLSGILGSLDMGSMMSSFRSNPAFQDRLVRRPVDAKNKPESSNNNMMGLSTSGDPYAEVLFHFGYGDLGKSANEKYVADNEEGIDLGGLLGGTDTSIKEEEKGPYYDSLIVADKAYADSYPDLAHSVVVMGRKLYFNIGTGIYTFNMDLDEMGSKWISSLNNLDLIPVKEYDEVTYTSNGKRFTGMSFVTAEEGTTLRYHPIAGLNVAKDYKNEGVETLFVSIATNLSKTYGNGYDVEARNYNPEYNRYFSDKEDESLNKNNEFMWCANVVDKMPVEELLADFASGATEEVSVDAYCMRNAYTQTRTVKFGLVKGEKVEEVDSFLTHNYVMDNAEGVKICTLCLEDDAGHQHSTARYVDTWAEDYSTCTREMTCSCGSTSTETVNSTVEYTTEPTCTETGLAIYTATFATGDPAVTEEVEVPATGHVDADGNQVCDVCREALEGHIHALSVVSDVWADDNSTCTRTWQCDTCGETLEETANAAVATVDATCTEAGKTTYTATFDNGESAVKEVELPALGHTDADGNLVCDVCGAVLEGHVHTGTAFTDVWADDKTSCTRSFTCTACGETATETVTAVVTTTNPTCTEAGKTTYTATFTVGNPAVVEDPIPATGHTDADGNLVCDVCGVAMEGHVHTGTTFTDVWAADYSTCTRSYVCDACGETVTENGNVTSVVITEATCGVEGLATYTATFSIGDPAVEDVVTPATGEHVDTILDGVCDVCGQDIP